MSASRASRVLVLGFLGLALLVAPAPASANGGRAAANASRARRMPRLTHGGSTMSPLGRGPVGRRALPAPESNRPEPGSGEAQPGRPGFGRAAIAAVFRAGRFLAGGVGAGVSWVASRPAALGRSFQEGRARGRARAEARREARQTRPRYHQRSRLWGRDLPTVNGQRFLGGMLFPGVEMMVTRSRGREQRPVEWRAAEVMPGLQQRVVTRGRHVDVRIEASLAFHAQFPAVSRALRDNPGAILVSYRRSEGGAEEFVLQHPLRNNSAAGANEYTLRQDTHSSAAAAGGESMNNVNTAVHRTNAESLFGGTSSGGSSESHAVVPAATGTSVQSSSR